MKVLIEIIQQVLQGVLGLSGIRWIRDGPDAVMCADFLFRRGCQTIGDFEHLDAATWREACQQSLSMYPNLAIAQQHFIDRLGMAKAIAAMYGVLNHALGPGHCEDARTCTCLLYDNGFETQSDIELLDNETWKEMIQHMQKCDQLRLTRLLQQKKVLQRAHAVPSDVVELMEKQAAKLDRLEDTMQRFFNRFEDVVGSAGSVASEVGSVASSWIRVSSSEARCFAADTLFTTIAGEGPGQVKYHMPASQLVQGSQVLAADGETILKVACRPEHHEVDELVLLCAGNATLQVTPDHRVPVLRGMGGERCDVPAAELQEGDKVYVDGKPQELTSWCHVLHDEKISVFKIAFAPDLDVAAFAPPPSIATKGFRVTKSFRRRIAKLGRSRQPATQDAAAEGSGDVASVPETARDDSPPLPIRLCSLISSERGYSSHAQMR